MANVTVYTTPTCPHCKRVKDFLTEKGIEFEEIDVSSDKEAAMKMVKKSGQMAVPQTEFNGNIIIGFDKEALKTEIAKM